MGIGKLLDRLFRSIVRLRWPLVLGVFIILFFSSWASIAYFEEGKPIASAEIFWWFFLVTTHTVGYGDFSPSTFGGRITATFIMVGGIGFFAVAAAKIADNVFQFTHRRLRGMVPLKLKGHLVIVGYQQGETEALVHEFKADSLGNGTQIVLCADIPENPLPKEMEFVAGNINDIEVLSRACLADAAQVIVYAASDTETFTAVVEAEHIAPDAHVVAYFNNAMYVTKLKRLFPGIECVSSLAVPMLVQCVQDPGSMQPITHIVSNVAGDANLYRGNLPTDFPETSFGDFFYRMKIEKGVTVIGVAESHSASAKMETNPPSQMRIAGGMSFFYLSRDRIEVPKAA